MFPLVNHGFNLPLRYNYAHLKELSEVRECANLDVVTVLGGVVLEDRQYVRAGLFHAQNPGHLMQGERQHTPNLPLHRKKIVQIMYSLVCQSQLYNVARRKVRESGIRSHMKNL